MPKETIDRDGTDENVADATDGGLTTDGSDGPDGTDGGGGHRPTVLDAPPLTRAERWLLPVALAALVGASTLSLSRGTPWSLLPLLPPLWFLFLFLRRPRIALGVDELVVRYVRTHRIPYADITAVRGDIPSRVEWSSRLFVERGTGRRVALPRVEAPLPQVHELITARLPRASGGAGAPPPADASA
jgi:hypothetical protein